MARCGEANALVDIEMLFRCFIGFIKSVKWDKENVYSAERHAFMAFTFKRVLTAELLNQCLFVRSVWEMLNFLCLGVNSTKTMETLL
jgi:hypothetical protein